VAQLVISRSVVMINSSLVLETIAVFLFGIFTDYRFLITISVFSINVKIYNKFYVKRKKNVNYIKENVPTNKCKYTIS